MKRSKAAHIFERVDADHYVEPSWVSARLFAVEKFASRIHDPACGWGTILQSAQAAGYRIEGSDIVRRRNGFVFDVFTKQDFLRVSAHDEPSSEVSIVCNPPFDQVEKFCRKACTLAGKVAMIMPVRRLNAAHWLEELPLQKIYLLTPRPSMPPGSWLAAGNGAGGGTVDFCWIIFSKGYTGSPQLRWLHRDD